MNWNNLFISIIVGEFAGLVVLEIEPSERIAWYFATFLATTLLWLIFMTLVDIRNRLPPPPEP